MQTTLEKQNTDTRPVRQEYVAPNVNIFETEEGYVLQAEMPGVGKDCLEVTLEGTEITITGRRNPGNHGGRNTLPRTQHGQITVACSKLDPAIDTAKVAAKIEQGVLTVNAAEIRACETSKNYGGLRRVLFTAPRARLRARGFCFASLGASRSAMLRVIRAMGSLVPPVVTGGDAAARASLPIEVAHFGGGWRAWLIG